MFLNTFIKQLLKAELASQSSENQLVLPYLVPCRSQSYKWSPVWSILYFLASLIHSFLKHVGGLQGEKMKRSQPEAQLSALHDLHLHQTFTSLHLNIVLNCKGQSLCSGILSICLHLLPYFIFHPFKDTKDHC